MFLSFVIIPLLVGVFWVSPIQGDEAWRAEVQYVSA